MEEEDEGQTPPEKSGFIGPQKPKVTAKKASKSTKQIEGAEALLGKLIKKGHKNCSIVQMPADLDKKTMQEHFVTDIAKLTNESRLYILGECIGVV